MKKVLLMIMALVFIVGACKKETSTPPQQKAPPKRKAPPIPTEVSYTSLKDIRLDGDKARGKRARVKGSVRDISSNFSIYARGQVLWLSFTEKEKPLLRKVNNDDKVVVEFLIEDPAAQGEEMGRLLDVKKR